MQLRLFLWLAMHTQSFGLDWHSIVPVILYFDSILRLPVWPDHRKPHRCISAQPTLFFFYVLVGFEGKSSSMWASSQHGRPVIGPYPCPYGHGYRIWCDCRLTVAWVCLAACRASKSTRGHITSLERDNMHIYIYIYTCTYVHRHCGTCTLYYIVVKKTYSYTQL